MTSLRRVAATTLPLLLLALACDSGDDSTAAFGDVSADRCIIRLHGKGERGASSIVTDDGIAILAPDGNASGWGARQWDYGTGAAIESARAVISTAADRAGCERVVVHGFSNGASMAAALLCSGDELDGRLVGLIVDDPVTDAATQGCRPPDVPVTLYWTGALDDGVPPGTRCDTLDWTCDGGVVRGIEAYASDLGVTPTASPFDHHRWYLDSPLPVRWLG